MGMYRRPFRRATAMMNRPVRTTSPAFSYFLLYYDVDSGIKCYGIVLSVCHFPELTCASFLVPNSYAVRVCKEFALLGKPYFYSGINGLFMCLSCAGSRGVSIIFSSGDGGVGDGNSNPATDQCLSNDGTNKTIFLPQFPASCPLCVVPITVSHLQISSHRPYCVGSVTTVGGTQGVPEVAAPYSGGGFSNYVSSSKMDLSLALYNLY